MVYTLILYLAVIVDFIGCSSHFSRNTAGEPSYGPSSSSAGNQHSPERPPRGGSPVRDRSRSPLVRPYILEVFGYPSEQLGYIRLIPRTNESIRFEFRRCIFPAGASLRLRKDQNRRVAMPTDEQIVLTLPNGDIFAILDHSVLLRGIYATSSGYPRIKMNIMSGTIEKMNRDELKLCPIGKKSPIFPYNFIKAFSDQDSLQSTWNPHSESDEQLLRARHGSPPGRPPSDQVLGYQLEQLGYIRLIPLENQNRRFEFRKYVFPANKPIRLQYEGIYMPVPNREHIVLSTSDGDVFAILEYTGFFRAIYTSNNSKVRVKINMISGEVNKMTVAELKECHVGFRYPILPRWFREELSDEDSLQHVYH